MKIGISCPKCKKIQSVKTILYGIGGVVVSCSKCNEFIMYDRKSLKKK